VRAAFACIREHIGSSLLVIHDTKCHRL
jgi:hypothetical protein